MKTGFAFIEYGEMRDAEDAVAGVNGTDFAGRSLRVEIARGRDKKAEGVTLCLAFATRLV